MDSDDEDNFKLPFTGFPADIGGIDAWDAEGLVAPYMPSTHDKVRAIISSITFNADDVFYDLGCGDGRVLFEAVARGCPKAVGVDIDAELINCVNETARAKGVTSQVETVLGDLLSVDISEATVLYLYLLPKALDALQAKVEAALKGGRLRLVITSLFDFPALQCERTHYAEMKYFTYVNRYQHSH